MTSVSLQDPLILCYSPIQQYDLVNGGLMNNKQYMETIRLLHLIFSRQCLRFGEVSVESALRLCCNRGIVPSKGVQQTHDCCSLQFVGVTFVWDTLPSNCLQCLHHKLRNEY